MNEQRNWIIDDLIKKCDPFKYSRPLDNMGLNCMGLLMRGFFFFNKYSWPFADFVSTDSTNHRSKSIFAFPIMAQNDVLFSICDWLKPWVQKANCRVKSYTRIFNCVGVGTPNPYVVQESTVVYTEPETWMPVN